MLAELREVSGIVAAKATAEESAAFREWLVATAQAAADAAKEGGFMGFRAVQVSEGEKAMLQQLRSELELNMRRVRMLILAIIVLGLAAGWVADMIVNKRSRPDDWGRVLLLGLVGSFIGGLLVSLLFGDGLACGPAA